MTGKDQLLQKWQIPHKLCEEVVAKFTPVEGKDVIIDFFSGGESYRRAVEAAGYLYIPVDLITMEAREQKTAEKLAKQQEKEERSQRRRAAKQTVTEGSN